MTAAAEACSARRAKGWSTASLALIATTSVMWTLAVPLSNDAGPEPSRVLVFAGRAAADATATDKLPAGLVPVVGTWYASEGAR